MRTKKEGGCGKAHVIRSLLHGATYGKESDDFYASVNMEEDLKLFVTYFDEYNKVKPVH